MIFQEVGMWDALSDLDVSEGSKDLVTSVGDW